MASNSSSWMVKTIQTARIHGVGAAERVGVPATEGAGAVAEGQMTILERADRASASLDARNRAEMAIRSSRRATTGTTDKTIGGSRLERKRGVSDTATAGTFGTLLLVAQSGSSDSKWSGVLDSASG